VSGAITNSPLSSISHPSAHRPKASEYNTLVPELCRFFGIIIRMFVVVQASHHTPHFHAYYQEHVAVYGIEPVELLAGGYRNVSLQSLTHCPLDVGLP
jgi:hypothetical protein